MISRGTERKKERKTNTYRNAPREDEHPENNAKAARNNALLRLFVLLVVCPFNKKNGMVFKLLLLVIQETNQRSEKVGFFVLEKRRNQFLSIQTTRRRSKSERSRAKTTTGFFPTRKRNREDAGVVGVVLF